MILNKDKENVWLLDATKLGKAYSFMQQSIWKHNLINLTCFGLVIVSIVFVFMLYWYLPLWLYLPMAIYLFGYWYLCLDILILHEASHGMFLLAKSNKTRKKLNMYFGSFFAPFLTRDDFRCNWLEDHNRHHIAPLIEEDPQNCPALVSTGKELVRKILKIWLVPGYAVTDYQICGDKVGYHKKHRNRKYAIWIHFFCWVAIAIFCYWLAAVPVFFAAIIGVNATQTLNRIKIAMEHSGDLYQIEDTRLRSRTSIFPLRWLIMPFNISIHFEHHLNCSIPWYNLIKFHNEVKKVVPAEFQSHCYNFGAKELLNRLR